MSGYIYAIGVEKTTFVKIGRSENPEFRLASLQIGSPLKLILIHKIKTEYPAKFEKFIHKELCNKNMHGEWFDIEHENILDLFSDALDKFIPQGIDEQVSQEGLGFGDYINMALKYRGMTQKELAEAIGISGNSLSRIIRGDIKDPKARMIRDISIVLDIPVAYLMGQNDTMEGGGIKLK